MCASADTGTVLRPDRRHTVDVRHVAQMLLKSEDVTVTETGVRLVHKRRKRRARTVEEHQMVCGCLCCVFAHLHLY